MVYDPEARMRALRVHKTGSLSDARVEDVPNPSPGTGEVLVRVRAAAVNPSDIKNVLGEAVRRCSSSG